MKIRDFRRSATALLVGVATLSLTACGYNPYRSTSQQFAGRPIPPTGLVSRVMVSVANVGLIGFSGGLSILDSARDIRNSVFNVNTTFSIAGYAANYPTKIINYPEQLSGFVYSNNDGSITTIDYSGEKSAGAITTLSQKSSDIAVSLDRAYVLAAYETAGLLVVADRTAGLAIPSNPGVQYGLPLPGVYRVAMNVSHTVMLAMTRNSDSVYRVVKLNQNDPPPAGYTSCMPQNLPVFCVVPVTPASGSFDRPTSAYFSPDGSKVYMLNCGPECGGTTSSVSTVNIDPLRIDNFNNVPVTLTTTAVPGGATAAISDGITLYVAGQQYQSANALFTGRLTTLDVNTQTVTGSYSISDGTHTKMLFGQDNSLWIGSQNCASGVRQATHQNYNCLTRFDTTTKTPKVLPVVDPNSSTATVPYPNENLDPYYYGSLTGLCWVQNYGKMYTAYGGQVHIFATADGTEINNSQVTVQGIALDVAYMDATTNSAN